jgi:hypothetical protein
MGFIGLTEYQIEDPSFHVYDLFKGFAFQKFENFRSFLSKLNDT